VAQPDLACEKTIIRNRIERKGTRLKEKEEGTKKQEEGCMHNIKKKKNCRE